MSRILVPIHWNFKVISKYEKVVCPDAKNLSVCFKEGFLKWQ